jgi:hypothetical protein
MNNLIIQGKTIVCGIEVPKIAGGFGPDKPAMLAKTIAELHNMKPMHVNEAINNHRAKFRDDIDVIDIKGTKLVIDLVDSQIITKDAVNASKNIYVLSRIGYGKLLKIFNDDQAWDKYEQILDEYFEMKETQFPVPRNFAEALRIAADQWEQNESLKLKNAHQQKEIDHKQDVIIGLVDEIDLASKRQVLNRVVRYKGANYVERWAELYRQFEMKYHIDLSRRLEAYNTSNKPRLKNKLDYIDRVMNKVPELYEIACKLYENDVKELVSQLYGLN